MEGEDPLKYEQCDHDIQELCFESTLQNFVHAAEAMTETVLFPSILMDSTVSTLSLELSPNELFLDEGMDLRAFCHMVKSLKIQLTQGCSYIEEGLEENAQMKIQIEKLCQQIRQSIRLAKYLGYVSEEIALSHKPLSYQEFTTHEIDEWLLLCEEHCSRTLQETLKQFRNAVEEMEKETLFPSLLDYHKAFNYGCSLDSEQTLHELYVNLLQLRDVLLASSSHDKHSQSSVFYEMVSKLKTVFYFYTIMINKILVLYQNEVHEEY